jgi:hypothetical protein
MSYRRHVVAAASLSLAMSTTASADFAAKVSSIRVTTAGVCVTAGYPSNPLWDGYCSSSRAVKIHIYRYVPGAPRPWQFHNECYANSDSTNNHPSYRSRAFCPFLYTEPIPRGTTLGRPPSAPAILVRTFKVDASCRYSGLDNFDDTYASGTVQPDSDYPAHTAGRLITIDKPSYLARIDRSGGALYEFASKQAVYDPTQTPLASPPNTIHSMWGAASQQALHQNAASGTPPIAAFGPGCLGQGYWHPSQAGAGCSTPTDLGQQAPAPNGRSGLHIFCDSYDSYRDTCNSAGNYVKVTSHRMFSYDYTTQYTGPYFDGRLSYPDPDGEKSWTDDAYLQQDMTAAPNYLQFDLTLQVKDGDSYSKVLGELPTYYFLNSYRRYYVPNPPNPASTVCHPIEGGAVTQCDVPLPVDGDETRLYGPAPDGWADVLYLSYNPFTWVTFEHVGFFLSNSFVTLAVFPDQSLEEDTSKNADQFISRAYAAETPTSFHMVKWTHEPRVDLKLNKLYRYRYVIFPYKYNDTITITRNGIAVSKQVREHIADMRAEYLGSNHVAGLSDQKLVRWSSPVLGKHRASVLPVPSEFTNKEAWWAVLSAPSASPATTALYECNYRQHSFVSTDPDCEGQRSLGAAGYLYATPQPDSTPIYRCSTADASDHIITTRSDCEGAFGYHVENFGNPLGYGMYYMIP